MSFLLRQRSVMVSFPGIVVWPVRERFRWQPATKLVAYMVAQCRTFLNRLRTFKTDKFSYYADKKGVTLNIASD